MKTLSNPPNEIVIRVERLKAIKDQLEMFIEAPDLSYDIAIDGKKVGYAVGRVDREIRIGLASGTVFTGEQKIEILPNSMKPGRANKKKVAM